MQKLLVFPTDISNAITEYYSNHCKEERILILYLKGNGNSFYVESIVVPPEEEYKISSSNYSSLKPNYLLAQIVNVLNEKKEGIMIMHNHTNCMPLFSSSDRQANNRFFRFFEKNNIDAIAGCAVYAYGKVSYVTNDSSLRNRYCVRLCNR